MIECLRKPCFKADEESEIPALLYYRTLTGVLSQATLIAIIEPQSVLRWR